MEGTQGDAYAATHRRVAHARKPDQVAQVCREGLRNSPRSSPRSISTSIWPALAELGEAEPRWRRLTRPSSRPRRERSAHGAACRRSSLRLGKWDHAIALGKKLLDEFDAPADRLRIRYALAGAYWGAKKTTRPRPIAGDS